MAMTPTLIRPACVALLALSLAGQAVAQEAPEERAEARERDMRGIVLGLAALAAIGIALHELDDDEEEEALPEECLANWPTGQGRARLYDANCLEDRFGAANELPLDCAVTVRSRGRFVSGFSPECLREEGWRTED